MKRSYQGAVAMLAICSAMPTLAADNLSYPIEPGLRPAYPEGWENPDDDIRFEFGAAYWYSWGGQNAGLSAPGVGDITLDVRDQTQIGELHGKIEDLSTQTYVAARAGLGLATTGTYNINPAGAGNIGRNSRIGYIGADYGWLPIGDMRNGFAFGGLIGYQYWKDAPDIGTGSVAATFDGAGNPLTLGAARDDFDIYALRLGVKGSAKFDMFDIQAEAAWLPYARVNGALGGSATVGGGGFNFPGVPVPIYENAQTTLSGTGTGVMAEAMVGFNPTDNLTIRLGGRAWYLQGNLDAVFNGTAGGGALPTMTLPSTYASIFRYGLRAELTGKF